MRQRLYVLGCGKHSRKFVGLLNIWSGFARFG